MRVVPSSPTVCYGALDPPVGGTFHFENLIMPPLTKTCPKMVLSHKGGSLCMKDVFAKKFFGAGRDSAGLLVAGYWKRYRESRRSFSVKPINIHGDVGDLGAADTCWSPGVDDAPCVCTSVVSLILFVGPRTYAAHARHQALCGGVGQRLRSAVMTTSRHSCASASFRQRPPGTAVLQDQALRLRGPGRAGLVRR